MTVNVFSAACDLDGGERARAASRVLRPTVEGPLYWRHMRAVLAVAAISIGLAASAVAQTGRSGGNKERRFFSARQGVGIEAPLGWTLSLHTGYPTVLVAFVHPGGSRISLAVDRTAAKDAAALAEQSKPGLLAQGLTIDRVGPGAHNGVILEARAASRNQTLRQLYVVRSFAGAPPPDDRQAVVVTLVAPVADLVAASGPFDWVLAHLTFETPVRPESKAEAKPDAGR